jgi:streptogramin lyase
VTLTAWTVERVVHFEPGTLCKDGFVHFGFHDRSGKHYLLEHQRHFLGLVGTNDELEWTVAAREVFDGVPNIGAELQYPIYIDSMPDGRLVVSNFGDGRLFAVDVDKMTAETFVDGPSLGIRHAGNCVVDDEGYVWVNEVDGCEVWRFDSSGKPILTLGDGTPGFQADAVTFEKARFNWIYDIRRGPDNNIYVLDSRNFAMRVIDIEERAVRTIAGTGRGGYSGDGGPAKQATFGSDASAKFDGPISLSLDEAGNIFVGDRHNHVVRMIHSESGVIETIAGRRAAEVGGRNDPNEPDPFKLNLPEISSMDYYQTQLLVPTDLTSDTGDLAVLRKS